LTIYQPDGIKKCDRSFKKLVSHFVTPVELEPIGLLNKSTDSKVQIIAIRVINAWRKPCSTKVGNCSIGLQEWDFYQYFRNSPKINNTLEFSFNSYLPGTYSHYTLVASTPSNPNYIMAWGYYSTGKIIVNTVDFRNSVLKGSFNSLISREDNEEGFKNQVPIEGTFDLK
jgi:hypothetical protein